VSRKSSVAAIRHLQLAERTGDDAQRLPRWFGSHLLLRYLGSGGMADVYLAREQGPMGVERLVAVKLAHRVSHPEQHDKLAQLFSREARISAQLNHPNIVHVHSVQQVGGTHCLVLEYVWGKTLKQLVSETARLSLPMVSFLGCEMLSGLEYLHEAVDVHGRSLGLVHRDISPCNVLLSYDGVVKLSDFGVAKATHRAEETSQGAIRGKTRYMSPEQAHGLPVDGRADLFAVGAVLFELLSGRALYQSSETARAFDGGSRGAHSQSSAELSGRRSRCARGPARSAEEEPRVTASQAPARRVAP
jgi:serine/threonine protein kinase